MSKFKASWLPEGEVELVATPILGQRELKALDLRDAKLQSLYTKQKFLAIARGIVASENVLTKLGVAKAKESWDEYITAEFGGFPLFVWPQETFESNLKETKEKFLFRHLAAKDDADAMLKLEKYKADFKAEAEQLEDDAVIKSVADRPLLILYWRLRASGVKKILLPTGEETLDWNLDASVKRKTMEKLAEVAGDADLEQLVEKAKRPTDMEEFKPRTAADVEGKSGTTSEPSTPSKPDSEPSSAPTGETTPP